MTAEEKIASGEAQLKEAVERLSEVTEQSRIAQARIEDLEKLKTLPPALVKANVKKGHSFLLPSQGKEWYNKGVVQ